MNVYIENSGCTRRKLDVSKLHSYFETNGYRIVTESDAADYILVSTCALKKEEEENSVQMLDSFRNSNGKVIVYGCLPVIAPSRFRSFDFDFVSPANINNIDRYFRNITRRFSELEDANLITQNNEDRMEPALSTAAGPGLNTLRHSARYVRSKYLGRKPAFYLFTSRGCLGNCSYCAAKAAIGPLQSKQVETVVEEFNRGIEAGYRDFIIIGDDVGAYGIDRGGSFPELLSALLAEADRKRNGTAANAKNTIRLSIDEFHPRWVIAYRNELSALLPHRSIAHFHCPILSGNDRILGLMERGGDSEAFIELLFGLHGLNRRMKLDSKIMAGFPSETEEDFEDTLSQAGRLPLNLVTVVPYEEKENTPACSIEPKVPADVIGRRVRKAQKYFRQKGIGCSLSCNAS